MELEKVYGGDATIVSIEDRYEGYVFISFYEYESDTELFDRLATDKDAAQLAKCTSEPERKKKKRHK